MKRRSFVKAIPAVTIPAMFGGFTVKAFGENPMLSAMANAYTETDHVLVLVRMAGGNDGLNTVIPLDQYVALTKARPNLVLDEKKVLKLNDKTALHPAMTGMKTLFDEGKLQVIQSVGYPSPSFSHFRATDIWMSASDSKEYVFSGWAGRYLNYEYPNFPVGYPNNTMPDPLAIEIGGNASQTFQVMGINTGIPIKDTKAFYHNIQTSFPNAPSTPAGHELAYIREVQRQADKYSDVIVAGAANAKNLVTYPSVKNSTGQRLGDQLAIVARLIAGGLKTRIYMVGVGGFDTHNNQVNANDHETGTQAELLGGVSDAILAFQRDLEAMKIADRVVGMTFSEFGRRVKSNDSGGTDHGAAAPLFVFGKGVKGGVTGTNVQVPANATVNDNVPMQYDFRSIYATLLQDWFCMPKQEVSNVLFKDFQKLNILTANCNTPVATHEANVAAGENLITIYPNPCVDSTTVQFESFGGNCMMQLFDNQGHLIQNLALGTYEPGQYSSGVDLTELPAGMYYIRYQNESLQQVKAVMKVR
jgi:uncharacterized protein (DUF1501 family)